LSLGAAKLAAQPNDKTAMKAKTRMFFMTTPQLELNKPASLRIRNSYHD
jgi:hypothetical protein